MNKSDFYFDLPQELIAQHPIEPRDASRLLVYHRDIKQIEHKHFFDIVDYLRAGDLLIINDTKVIPARIFGHKKDSTGRIEFLLLKRLSAKSWQVLVKPGRYAKIGAEFTFCESLSAVVTDIVADGVRIVDFIYDGVFEEILDRIGQMPLPPYIKEKLNDKTRYNTVYSKHDGSAAAPTAGLHFTPALLDKLRAKGIDIESVLLHVGLGTFRPLKEDNIEDHIMHSEYYEITSEVAEKINCAKKEGRRVIAVGTTSTRVLESVADDNGYVSAGCGETDIFIYPPYKFKVIDGLITNFHLPESTLVMLVSALCSREEVLDVYKTAVSEKYRFFSFGDATFFI